MQDDLSQKREKVNQIDSQLVELLNQRARVALEIGVLKAKMGAKMYDPDRERAVLEHIEKLNTGPLGKGAIDEIFATIITACREIQSQ